MSTNMTRNPDGGCHLNQVNSIMRKAEFQPVGNYIILENLPSGHSGGRDHYPHLSDCVPDSLGKVVTRSVIEISPWQRNNAEVSLCGAG